MTPFSRLAVLSAFFVSAALAQDPAIRTVPFANTYPTGYPPRDAVWSPDGSRLTFMSSDPQIGQPGDIVAIDVTNGKVATLATAAQLARLSSAEINEKDADHRARYAMSSFLWADDSKHLLLDQGGRLYLYDIAAGTGTLVVDTGAGSGDDPKFSPDAKSVSYLRNHNLYVHPSAGADAKETALTTDKSDALLNGEVDWVYLEELDVRSNYFWSPDSQSIAYLQADETKVPEYPITDFVPTHATIDQQRYPQPGDPNPAVRIGVVQVTGGPTTWIQLPFSPGNDYIPRFGWVDSHTVYIETMKRSQKERDLYLADTRTGKIQLIYADTDPKYLNFDYDITLLSHGRFVTSSWRDGFTHLYLYRFDEAHPLAGLATLVRKLTPGDYDVASVNGFDEKTNTLFFTANEAAPTDSYLFSVKLDSDKTTRLTPEPGSHDALVSPDHKFFADSYSTFSTPTTARICPVDDATRCGTFWRSYEVPAATGVTSSIVSFTAADGKTKIYATLTLPAGKTDTASIPLIMNPYGGPLPGVGVHNGFGSPYFDELLAQHGFAVLNVDGRGGGGRGRDFQQVAYDTFGSVQFSDQMAALDQALARYPQFDPKRIGWWGWSWGGSFTLYAMTHTDRIKAGVAVAPVTDFRNYDSIYTERYMGLPTEDKAGYDAASLVLSAPHLKGHLLIAQGTGDDNVHMANTIQFLEPLIDNGIPYDLQLFPRKTHSIAGMESRNELFERILAQFEKYLK